MELHEFTRFLEGDDHASGKEAAIHPSFSQIIAVSSLGMRCRPIVEAGEGQNVLLGSPSSVPSTPMCSLEFAEMLG